MKALEIYNKHYDLMKQLESIMGPNAEWQYDPDATSALMFLAYELGLRDGPKGYWYMIHGSEQGRFSMFSHLAHADRVWHNEGTYKKDSRQPACNRRLAWYCATILTAISGPGFHAVRDGQDISTEVWNNIKKLAAVAASSDHGWDGTPAWLVSTSANIRRVSEACRGTI